MAQTNQPVRILCLDGGGIRGVSTIEILKTLCDGYLKKEPHQAFDLICGTSTGGILAILLGVLRLSLDECLDIYDNLGKEVFDAGLFRQGLGLVTRGEGYSGEKLEQLIKEIVKKHLGDSEAPLGPRQEGQPRVFVVATRVDVNNSTKWLFRNYDDVFTGGESGVPIWQAARATSAAPTYFTPITIKKFSYRDGGLGFNNPSNEALTEAARIPEWKDREKVVVSIGTGMPITEPAGSGVTDLMTALKNVATDCENLARQLEHQQRNYFRFNTTGIGHFKLDAHEFVNAMRVAAQSYVDTAEVNRKMVEVKKKLQVEGIENVNENSLC